MVGQGEQVVGGHVGQSTGGKEGQVISGQQPSHG